MSSHRGGAHRLGFEGRAESSGGGRAGAECLRETHVPAALLEQQKTQRRPRSECAENKENWRQGQGRSDICWIKG